ncbi:MAG: ribonuclease P protein component [Chloroflexi bacterium]|nr:ribonuclease P protein component [Chloroflexota bacterium]
MRTALRLRQSSDFARVRQEGKVYRHRVMLLSLRDNGLPGNRYGFVVGKHVGAAVSRNRCKRRLRALIDSIHDCVGQGFDIVIVARPAILQQPYSELQRIVSVLFQRAQLLKVG